MTWNVRWLAAHLLIAAGLLLTGAAVGAQSLPSPPAASAPQPEPEPEPAEEQVRALIETLQDPARRDQLIAQLKALLDAQREAEAVTPAQPEDAVGWLLGEVSERTEVVRTVAQGIVGSLDEVPVLLSWMKRQLLDESSREVWLWAGIRILLVLGFGALGYLAMTFALRRLRAGLTSTRPLGAIDRLARGFLLLIVELLPVVAFAITAYATLTALDLRYLGRAVVLPLVNAVIVVRTGIALTRVLFAPQAPAHRLLPVSDRVAHYATRWTRRLLATSIYGYFILAAGRRLGLPWTLHGFLLHVLFFAVTVMAMIVIAQSRERVAAAIAALSEEGRSRTLQRLPWGTLAGVWHVLALLYVLSIYLVWALKIPGGFQALLEATLGSFAIVVSGWLVWRALDQIFHRDAPADEEHAGLLTGFERRINRYFPLLGGLAHAGVLVLVVVGLFEVWGFGTLGWLFSEAGNTFIGRVLTVLVIVAVTIGAWELISVLIERSITEKDAEGNLRLSNRTRTLLNITRNFLLVFLSLIALFLILSELGLDIAPLLAGAGVIGLAIGFGSQKLVQDIITGMFMLVGDTIRVGDVVQVAGRAGVVEKVTMRTVQLRDYAGSVHTIPYSAIDTVTNMTKEFSYAVLDIGVAYRERVDEVMEVLRDIGAEMNRDPNFRRLILEPLEVAGVDAFTDSSVVIKVRVKTRPLKQWDVSREFRRRVKNRFDELGIEIPFPHQTVYFGLDKAGRAAPVRVNIEHAQPAAEAPPAPAEVQEARPVLAQSRSG